MYTRFRNPQWLRHDRTRQLIEREARNPVTVCVATICRWNYGTLEKRDDGWAGILVTDRMITAGDIQYEPNQLKVGSISPHVLMTVAGDYGYHSRAIKRLMASCGDNPTPENAAAIYAQELLGIKRAEAEALYLAPLGLNTDTFIAQTKEMSDPLVASLQQQMQAHKSDEAEAIIIGSEFVKGHHVSRIFSINTYGITRCYDDIGFTAIGSGATHALSRLMQIGYVNHLTYVPALASAFAAKKSAEIAPGVGKHTDVRMIFRTHNEELDSGILQKLEELYAEYEKEHSSLALRIISELGNFVFNQGTAQPNAQGPSVGTNAPTDGAPVEAAAEAPREDEAGEDPNGHNC